MGKSVVGIKNIPKRDLFLFVPSVLLLAVIVRAKDMLAHSAVHPKQLDPERNYVCGRPQFNSGMVIWHLFPAFFEAKTLHSVIQLKVSHLSLPGILHALGSTRTIIRCFLKELSMCQLFHFILISKPSLVKFIRGNDLFMHAAAHPH
jgi:hypothetical protein